MMRFLQHSEIDRANWDACVDRSPNSIIYAYSWYLDRVAPGWGALVEGDYDTIMPLPMRSKAMIQYVYQPYFVQQLGVFGKYSHHPEVCDRFLEAVFEKFRWVDYNLNSHNVTSAAGKSYCRQKGRTHLLDLVQPVEQIRAAYSQNTLRNLAKAKRMGVFIVKNSNPEEIIDAFRNHKGKILHAYGAREYELLKRLTYNALHLGLAHVSAAYDHSNSFCGGIIVLKSKHKAVLLFTGSTPLAFENGAMFSLVDDFIATNAGNEMVLDFEGSSDPNLARFYKGFGAKEIVFLRIQHNRLPPGVEELVKCSRFFRKKIQIWF